MRESKHTPGPWTHDGFHVWGPTDPRSKHKNGRTLVGGVVDTLTDWRGLPAESPEDRRSFDAERDANARLISAAPELLAACEALDAAAEDFKSGKRDGATMGRVSLAMDAARSALRRARGEA